MQFPELATQTFPAFDDTLDFFRKIIIVNFLVILDLIYHRFLFILTGTKNNIIMLDDLLSVEVIQDVLVVILEHVIGAAAALSHFQVVESRVFVGVLVAGTT